MEATRHIVVPELDLTACSPASIVDRINDVTALRTSAAFLTFLRANLVLNSAMSSQTNTPVLEPVVHIPLPSFVPSSLSTMTTLTTSEDGDWPSASSSSSTVQQQPGDKDIPPLSLEVLSDDEHHTQALRLIADSIAQQRQRASLNVLTHPVCLASLMACLGVIYRCASDFGTAIILSCGLLMTLLICVKHLTSPYLTRASSISRSFLSPSGATNPQPSERDLIIGTIFNDKLIGAVVLRLEPGTIGPNGGHGRRRGRNSFRGGKGIIRAWTTALKFRGQGVGRDMLDEAVRITKERCGKDAEVGFAKEHANCRMILPDMFNGSFKKGEIKATRALDEAVSRWEGSRKKW